MKAQTLKKKDETEEKPFVLNFAERIKRNPIKKSKELEVFDDPSTTEVTKTDVEDMHTDED